MKKINFLLAIFLALTFLTGDIIIAQPTTPPAKCFQVHIIQRFMNPVPGDLCYVKVNGVWVFEGQTNTCETAPGGYDCNAHSCKSGEDCNTSPINP